MNPHWIADSTRVSHEEYVRRLYRCASQWASLGSQYASQAERVLRKAKEVEAAGEEGCAVYQFAKLNGGVK
jgi:hypothetical protein